MAPSSQSCAGKHIGVSARELRLGRETSAALTLEPGGEPKVADDERRSTPFLRGQAPCTPLDGVGASSGDDDGAEDGTASDAREAAMWGRIEWQRICSDQWHDSQIDSK